MMHRFSPFLSKIDCLHLQASSNHDRLPANLSRFIPTIWSYCPLHPESKTLATTNHVFFQCPQLTNPRQSFEDLVLLFRALHPRFIQSLLAIPDPSYIFCYSSIHYSPIPITFNLETYIIIPLPEHPSSV